MRQLIKANIFILTFAFSLSGLMAEPNFKRLAHIEFSFWGGYVTGSPGPLISNSYLWAIPPTGYNRFEENGKVDADTRNGAGLNVSAAYILSPYFGIEISLGFIYADSPCTATYQISWILLQHGLETTSSFIWPGSGTLVSLPLSFNLIANYGSGRWGGYLSMGPTIFLHSYVAETQLGYATNFGILSDAFKIDLETNSNIWLAPGGNIGIGVYYNLTPALSVVVDARYFLCPAKNLCWNVLQGDYSGLFNDSSTYRVGEKEIATIQNEKDLNFKINPSSLKIAIGMKFKI